MIQLIAFDLDETLVCTDKTISKGNLEALIKAKEMGIKLVPATGRGPFMLQEIYDTLHIFEKEQYSILCNGGIIVDNYTNDVLISHPFPKHLLHPLFNFGLEHNLDVQIFTKDHMYVYNTDPEEIKHIENAVKGHEDYIVYKYDTDLSYLDHLDIIKMLYQRKDMNYLLKIKEELDWTKDEISISFSSGKYLELNQKGINKGVGLKELSNYLNIDIQNTIGIGDYYNDYELIKEAGIGCAVQNALEECKSVATYVTKSDNNHDAFKEIIENFVL